jgi:hypothetical protein
LFLNRTLTIHYHKAPGGKRQQISSYLRSARPLGAIPGAYGEAGKSKHLNACAPPIATQINRPKAPGSSDSMAAMFDNSKVAPVCREHQGVWAAATKPVVQPFRCVKS